MNLMRTALALAFCAMLLCSSACTPNLPYRTSFAADDSPWADPAHAVIETKSTYKIGFVEFDDQGWFWDTDQDDAVRKMVRTEAGLSAVPTSNPTTEPAAKLSTGIIIVAFVHGWKDNAEAGNEGVRSFEKILGALSLGEKGDAKAHHRDPRKVVGVYAGWRGLSLTWEPAKELSIWDRGDTAKRVGGNGALTQLFTQLENIQKDSLDSLPADTKSPTELIIIGHSLGASATYAALSQVVNERFVNSVGKGWVPIKDKSTGADTGKYEIKRLKPLGDQIILINPAFEASRHFDLNQMATALDEYPQDQRPVLTILTSRGDWATHYVFPIAMFFPTLFDSYRDDGQQYWTNIETVGWYDPFTTHRLVYNPKISYKSPDDAAIPTPTTEPLDITDQDMANIVTGVDRQRAKWKPGHHAPKQYYFDKVALQPLPNYHPGDPILIVSVDKQIIEDHTDISNKTLVNFIRDYINFCHADTPVVNK